MVVARRHLSDGSPACAATPRGRRRKILVISTASARGASPVGRRSGSWLARAAAPAPRARGQGGLRPPSLPALPADDDQIVRGADKPPELGVAAPRRPDPGRRGRHWPAGRDHAALRGAGFGVQQRPVGQHTRPRPALDEVQHAPVGDPFAQRASVRSGPGCRRTLDLGIDHDVGVLLRRRRPARYRPSHGAVHAATPSHGNKGGLPGALASSVAAAASLRNRVLGRVLLRMAQPRNHHTQAHRVAIPVLSLAT
jgi:hypothetical protein